MNMKIGNCGQKIFTAVNNFKTIVNKVEKWDIMTSLCYPYGSGITCVCDEPGRIYKCFPDIKSDPGISLFTSIELNEHDII